MAGANPGNGSTFDCGIGGQSPDAFRNDRRGLRCNLRKMLDETSAPL
jgi:hypothetical protein